MIIRSRDKNMQRAPIADTSTTLTPLVVSSGLALFLLLSAWPTNLQYKCLESLLGSNAAHDVDAQAWKRIHWLPQ
jgi:hypothetical protein